MPALQKVEAIRQDDTKATAVDTPPVFPGCEGTRRGIQGPWFAAHGRGARVPAPQRKVEMVGVLMIVPHGRIQRQLDAQSGQGR